MPRVQFDITDDVYERALPYIGEKKYLGYHGLNAFKEWLRRREARDGRALTQDEQKIKKIVKDVLKEMDR